jgi:hypothetical protein
VDNPNTKKPVLGNDAVPEAERRRIGRVVHDERGNASVSWRDAPADHKRHVLEVLGEGSLSLKSEETFDPYARPKAEAKARPATGNTARTDLRKLSEWIKMMRELEERKRGGGGESSA